MTYLQNPLATDEQHRFELRALEIFNSEPVAVARAEVREHWLREADPSTDMLGCFDAAFEEVMFGAVIWSLNQDPMNPAVVTISRVAHELQGQRVPGSRWGIDNPDSVYRVIPISGSEQYIIRGSVARNRLSENYFTLWDEKMNTVDVLDGSNLQLDDAGQFEITVDANPAAGRPNHIQSDATAHQFYIRDVLQDWDVEMVNSLTIERIGATTWRQWSDAEDIANAIRFMWDYANNTMRWNQQALGKPVNSFDFKIDRDTDGALRNQVYIMGQFQLGAGEVLVVDIDLGGANYFIAPITNIWGTTNKIQDANGSMNLAQSRANADGGYTFVVSVDDPGVVNWIDTAGMSEGILTLRWAEFVGGEPAESLSASGSVVQLSELGPLLDMETQGLSKNQRQQQLEAREKSYAWRVSSDHAFAKQL